MGLLNKIFFQKKRETNNLRTVTFEKTGEGFFGKLFSKEYHVVEVRGEKATVYDRSINSEELAEERHFSASELEGDFYHKFDLYNSTDSDNSNNFILKERQPSYPNKTNFSLSVINSQEDLQNSNKRRIWEKKIAEVEDELPFKICSSSQMLYPRDLLYTVPRGRLSMILQIAKRDKEFAMKYGLTPKEIERYETEIREIRKQNKAA